MLTIIALFLMATLWIIIPDPDQDAPANAEAASLEKTLIMQKDSLTALQSQHEQLQRQVRDYQKLQAASEVTAPDNSGSARSSELLEQVTAMKERVKVKTAELEAMQKKLAEITKKAADKKFIEQMEQQIAQQQQQIRELQPLLQQLNKQLGKAQAHQTEVSANASPQQDTAARLLQEIGARKLVIAQMESVRLALEKTLATSRGLARYRSSAGKNQIAFECFGNTVLLMDGANYKTDTFLATSNSLTQLIRRAKRMVGARGESLLKMTAPTSRFLSTLVGKSPQNTYLYFFVHGDSQEIFLKAREIAWAQGYSVGWAPFEGDTFYMSNQASLTQRVR